MKNWKISRYLFFLTIIFLSISCRHPEKKTLKNDFWIKTIPQDVSYSFRVNKKLSFSRIHSSVIAHYLNETDRQYLDQLKPQIPFTFHIFQKDPRLQSFLFVGQTSQFQKLFNQKERDYNGVAIYQSEFNKHKYYGFQQNGIAWITNRSLRLESIIREIQNPKPVDTLLKKAHQLLDDNSDMNLIIFPKNLRQDQFSTTLLKINPNEMDALEAYDIVDAGKDLYTGVGLKQSQDFIQVFSNIDGLQDGNFAFVPVTVSQFSIFSTDDLVTFLKNYDQFSQTEKRFSEQKKETWESLKSILLMKENHNIAMILTMDNTEDFLKDKPLEENFMNYQIRHLSNPLSIIQRMDKLFPQITLKYFLIKDGHIILTDNISYLRKLIVDIDNHHTLAFDDSFKRIMNESSNQQHLINFLKKNGKFIYKSYDFSNDIINLNLVITSFGKQSRNEVEQFLSKDLEDVPVIQPQLVYNYKHKTYRIIYQNDKNQLVYMDMSGNVLWKRDLDKRILGKIKTVDLYRNGKTQYAFVTPDKWYIIDRYGRDVENFPKKFNDKITQALSVFDYDKNRKYRFGITQGTKFLLFDNDGKQVKGFEVKTEDNIAFAPQHFRIGSKDFILIQEKNGQLNLLDRRGNARIKVDEKFDNIRQDWKVYHKKFVNITKEGKFISIDMKGKIKKGNLQMGNPVSFNTGFGHFVAISDQKLLIDKNFYNINLGNYITPTVYKDSKNQTVIFLSDMDNQKIYAYNLEGKLRKGFPVIGKKVLDVRKHGNQNYLLIYDISQNLLIYKF